MLNKKLLIVFGIFILSFLLVIFIFYINSIFILEKQEIQMRLIIGDSPGFNLDDGALNFGEIIENSIVEREILVENIYSSPIFIELNPEGNITKFLSFDKIIYFKEGESKKIKIKAIGLPDSFGDYSGKLILEFRKIPNK